MKKSGRPDPKDRGKHYFGIKHSMCSNDRKLKIIGL